MRSPIGHAVRGARDGPHGTVSDAVDRDRCIRMDAPVLLPTTNTALRRDLDEWFEKEDVRPRVVGEFEDTALMKVFGQGAPAVFPGPAAIEQDICRFYGVRVVGRTGAVRERYYALAVERRLKHPGVLAITSAAREEVFR